MNPRTLTAPATLLCAAVLLGIAFDRLFFNQWLGINFPVFTLLLLGGTGIVSRRENLPLQNRNLALLVPAALFFAAMCAVRANPTVTVLNLLYTLVLLVLAAYFWAAGNLWNVSVRRFLFTPLWVVGNISFRVVEPMVLLFEQWKRRSETSAPLPFLPILRGLLIALPILLVFGALLSSADAVFGKYMGNCFQSLTRFEIYFPHLILIGIIFWITAGAITSALTRYENVAETPTALAHRPFGFVESLTVLGSVNLLFLSFLLLQFSYLFGGAKRALAVSGLNYAEYARRGFWELVVVALLAGGLIVLLREITRRLDDRTTRIFAALGTSLIGCTLCLLISAAQRMNAYEQAWGATELRIIVDVFLVWLALALSWMGVTLWHWSDRLVVGVLICAVGYMVTLNLVDLDNYVVTRNREIYRQTGRLDTEHLSHLSDDAVPALADAYTTLAGKEKAAVHTILQDKITDRRRTSPWNPDFNFSRYRAMQTLENLLKTGKTFSDTNPKAESVLPESNDPI